MIGTKTADRLATGAFYAVGFFTAALLVVFVGYLLVHGWSKLNPHFLLAPPEFVKAGGGIGPQLFDSVYMLVMAMAITIPVGLAAGIYMAEYAKPGKLTDTIRLCIETLASLPSIVIGLFGLIIFVNLTGWGYTLFGGALAVAVLNLPVATRVSEDAIRSVPQSIREASYGLGATQWQTITRAVLPAALPGLLTGFIMTAGRAFGEAAALLYTAGMSTPLLDYSDLNPFSNSSPLNPFRPGSTLAVYIWKVNSEGLVPDAREIADGASAVLVLAVLGFNLMSRYLGSLLSARLVGRRG
ncbi:MAG TPA: phosphate ABC transporter permease PstA [Selenomonadales bacterium]|nr:phosphate ABC transporter permease PstA [Selenomonadales bacterium]